MKAGSVVSILICVSLLLAGSREVRCQQAGGEAQGQAPAAPVKLDKRAAKIRRVVEKARIGGRVTVVHNDGKDYHGAVSGIGEDAFQIVEVDLNQTMAFKYDEVKRVRTGYGPKNIFGRRPDPKKSAVIFAGVMAGLFTLIVLSIPRT